MPQLEVVLTDPLMHLMGHDMLLGITQQECNIKVVGVGSVLFQLLAVQHKLQEPLDLNGDLIEDLKNDTVVACRPNGEAALNAMFSAIPTTSMKSEFRPPTFRHGQPSHFPPTDPIPVVVNGMSKRKKNKEVDTEKLAKQAKLDPRKEWKGRGITMSKCRGDDEIDDEKPAKHTRTHQEKAQEDIQISGWIRMLILA
ncbi:hypothetical protein C8J57DRAFT_1228367 [Mycena rebaudengoi]|nr:hypothetical protein C8J57DRAFT_1228367 [Mycena rebaudengoi]